MVRPIFDKMVAISFKFIKEVKPSLDSTVEELKKKLNLGIGPLKFLIGQKRML
jgi:hypothetical protein